MTRKNDEHRLVEYYQGGFQIHLELLDGVWSYLIISPSDGEMIYHRQAGASEEAARERVNHMIEEITRFAE